jgi:putative transcriptional regulator
LSPNPRLPEAEPLPIRAPRGARRLALALSLLLVASLLGAPAAAEDAKLGQLLIAKDSMADPRFRETVILVTRHGGHAAVGVVLNRPSGLVLSDIFPSADSLSERTDRVFFGGPVSRDAMVLLFRSDEVTEHALPVAEGLYLTTDAALLEKRLRRSGSGADMRIFLGYAGWAPGQLEAELMRGDWYTLEVDAKTIFEKDPKRIWREFHLGLGGQPI